MPPPEIPRKPEQNMQLPAVRAERGVTQIESKIPYYQKNIVPDGKPFDVEGYDASLWRINDVLRYENNIFVASKDGKTIHGFKIVGTDEQGEIYRQLNMSQYPEITSVLRQKFHITPIPPIVRAEQARQREEVRQPETRIDGSVESVLSVLQQISVEARGEKLAVTWPSASVLSRYLRTNNVPTTRYSQYVKNIRDHAALLSTALRSSSFGGRITFDGQNLYATDGRTTLMTTATRVLKKSPGGTFTTLDGNNVGMRENATTTQYTIQGRTEVHRRDGGLQLVQEGSTIRYYDGSNVKPLITKNGNDVSVSGPYGSVGVRPRGDTEAYGREIASTLRTPEAIGAFISQFYHGQDFNGNTAEHNAYLSSIQSTSEKPVRYVPDVGNQTQDWKKTLERGAGDCEDFALLAEGLLRQAGIRAFAMMVSPRHYETVYFEKASDGQYYVCTVGLRGFTRSTKTFPSLGTDRNVRPVRLGAVESLWEGSGSGAQVALRNPTIRAQFANPRDPNRYPENSPGIFQLRQPTDPVATSDMVEYSDEEFFAQYVRG